MLVPLGKQPKNSIITVAYMYSFVLKDVTKLKVFFPTQMIEELMDNYYWWGDDVMNTFLCILSHIFHKKYSNSVIHPQVVVVDFFSYLDKKNYADLIKHNEHLFSSFSFPMIEKMTVLNKTTPVVDIMLYWLYISHSIMCLYIVLVVIKKVF